MRGYWDTYPQIKTDIEKVRFVIEEALKSGNPLLSEAMEKILSRNGKMLRPAFVLLAARTKPLRGKGYPSGKPLPEKMYKIAAAVEIMHMATLVHDDVIDRAAVRRGEPSLNVEYGERRAVLIGDYLFSRCFSLVADHASMQNARFLAKGVSYICDSEISQSRRFDPSTLSVRDYLHRIIGKTAILFSLSFHVGASENGVPPGLSGALRRIGYNVGMSFQITDDLLDFLGNEKTLGKPAGGDLREGIYTLPVIHAFRADPEGLAPLLEKAAGAEAGTMEKIVEKIQAAGGFEKTRRLAAAYTERALREAEKLPPTENRRVLVEVVRNLLDRSF